MSTGKIMSFDEKKRLGFILEDSTNKIYPFRVKNTPIVDEDGERKKSISTHLKDDLVSFDIDNHLVINVTKIEKTN